MIFAVGRGGVHAHLHIAQQEQLVLHLIPFYYRKSMLCFSTVLFGISLLVPCSIFVAELSLLSPLSSALPSFLFPV